MGIPISGASYIYEDNMSVIHNTSRYGSTPKRCNANAYRAICESVAMRESLTGHIRSEVNPADLLTKGVTGQKRKHLVSSALYETYIRNTNNGQEVLFLI